ncbi:MAG: hypothetical protein LBP59_02140 [Planctomycetaceae bacterium]|jgi:hypothetical protein|nr:hypothetical protein [Planctomycetaceae bacterium]
MTWKEKLIDCFRSNPYGIAGFADFSCLTKDDKKAISDSLPDALCSQDALWTRDTLWVQEMLWDRDNPVYFYAVLLYKMIQYAKEHYDEGRFYDENFNNIFLKYDRPELSRLFCDALVTFGYFANIAEIFPDSRSHITPYLIHAGIPDNLIDKFIELVAANRHYDYRQDSYSLCEVVKQSSVHINIKRIFQLNLAGVDEIWFCLTDMVNAYYKDGDYESYLVELPFGINRDRVITALKNLEDKNIELAYKISRPYVKFNPAYRNFTIHSKEEIKFNQESLNYLENNQNNRRYEWTIIKPPNEKLQLDNEDDKDKKNITLFFEQDGAKIMVFDMKTYRLLEPEEIDRKGLLTTKYLIFADKKISLSSVDCGIDSGVWGFYGFYGAVIDFGSENHQTQKEHSGTLHFRDLCFNLEKEQTITTITFKKNRFDESNVINFIDDTGAHLSPIMQVEADIAGESIYLPLFNSISHVQFSSPKTKEIQLYKYNANNKKWEPHNTIWSDAANGDFYCNSKIEDGIYQIRDKKRSSKQEIFVVLFGFQKLYEKYNNDNSEFEVAFNLLTNGKLIDKQHENKKQIDESGNIFFKKATLYPVLALIWEWDDAELGSFTLFFHLRGIRWRILSLQEKNTTQDNYIDSIDSRWMNNAIIVNKKNTSNKFIELQLPEKRDIVINRSPIKQIKTINNGGSWDKSLSVYVNSSEDITLTLDDKDIPLVYFAEQSLIENFEWSVNDKIAEIKWEGYTPDNSVLLIWNPLKPNSFREITLQDNSNRVCIDSIDAETFYCFTLAVKCGGWQERRYSIAINQKYNKSRIKRHYIGLSQTQQEKNIAYHFYLLFQNLLDETLAKDCPFDYKVWLRADEICQNKEDKEKYFSALKIFCDEMNELDKPYFKNTLKWDDVNKKIGIDKYVKLAGKWLPSLLNLVHNDNSREFIRETFIDETRNGMNFAWIKPYQIAECDCMDDNWNRYNGCPAPFEYFRDLWLISSPYHQVKILSTCAKKNNCQHINKSLFENKVNHWQFYEECNNCGQYFDDHESISLKRYIECQQAALNRLLEIHKKFNLPELESLTPFDQKIKFQLPYNNNQIYATIRKYPDELRLQLGLDNSEVLLINYPQKNFHSPQTGYKIEHNIFNGKTKISQHKTYNEKIFSNQHPYRMDPAIPLIAKVNSDEWIKKHAGRFRQTLVQLNRQLSTDAIHTNTIAINYIKDILGVKHVLHQLVEKTCEPLCPCEKVLRLGGNNMQIKINNESVTEQIQQFWQHAILERLFVNDSVYVKEKLGDDSKKLEQYLRKTTAAIYENNLTVYYQIQALAELAVWVCYNGGIGTFVKTEFE